MVNRDEFLAGLIGKPWVKGGVGPDEFDCWGLVCYVRSMLYGNVLPNVDAPKDMTRRWMIEQFSTNEELKNWKEISTTNGLVLAPEGSVVLMARLKNPIHCGIWFEKEQRVLHCCEPDGVVFQGLLTLKAYSWGMLKFYERTT